MVISNIYVPQVRKFLTYIGEVPETVLYFIIYYYTHTHINDILPFPYITPIDGYARGTENFSVTLRAARAFKSDAFS